MKKILNQIILLSIIYVMMGCTSDKIGEEGATGSTVIPVKIQLNMTVPGQTRGNSSIIATPQENQVDDVHVFFVRSNDVIYTVAEGKLDPLSEGEDPMNNKIRTFTTSIIVEGLLNDELTVYAYANIKSTIDKLGIDYFTDNHLTYTEAVKKELSNLSLQADNPIKPGFVMWGKASTTIAPGAQKPNIEIPLFRAIARVDVGLGSRSSVGVWNHDEVDNFKLKSVTIYNTNSGYMFTPNLNVQEEKQKGIHITDDIKALEKNIIKYNTKNDLSISNAIYIPENDVVLGGKPGDINHEKRCAIVVGGLYTNSQGTEDEKETFYRIDFSGVGKPLIDVMRNHLYSVNITEVKGSGFIDEETAYKNKSFNMDAEVVEWNDVPSEDIIFDGTHWVHIKHKTMYFPGSEGIVGLIPIASNVDVDKWKITPYSTGAEDYFTIEKPKTEEGNLVITTLKTIESRQEVVFKVQIENLQFFIKLIQEPDLPEDWIPGPNYEIEL